MAFGQRLYSEIYRLINQETISNLLETIKDQILEHFLKDVSIHRDLRNRLPSSILVEILLNYGMISPL